MTTFGSSQDGVATNVTTETKTLQTGRTRVYGVHISGPATAGVLDIKDGSTSKVKLNKAGHVHDMTVNLPVAFIFFVDATGIVVALDEIPDVKVVVIPLAFPSDGDLKIVYSF